MSDQSSNYEPLTVGMIPARLGKVKAVTDRLGSDITTWKADEVGDDLVFIVKGAKGTACGWGARSPLTGRILRIRTA